MDRVAQENRGWTGSRGWSRGPLNGSFYLTPGGSVVTHGEGLSGREWMNVINLGTFSLEYGAETIDMPLLGDTVGRRCFVAFRMTPGLDNDAKQAMQNLGLERVALALRKGLLKDIDPLDGAPPIASSRVQNGESTRDVIKRLLMSGQPRERDWDALGLAAVFFKLLGIFGLACTPFAAVWCIMRTRAERDAARLQAGQCPKCCYAINGLRVARCPECGTALSNQQDGAS
jgi:hypothetical protein